MAPERGEKGTLAMSARTSAINGKSYPINANASSYQYDMKARGVNAGEVATTGAGAVVGGVIGHALGGGTGTVVGAVGGGAAGAAIASKVPIEISSWRGEFGDAHLEAGFGCEIAAGY